MISDPLVEKRKRLNTVQKIEDGGNQLRYLGETIKDEVEVTSIPRLLHQRSILTSSALGIEERHSS
jgi:hypothetical protein